MADTEENQVDAAHADIGIVSALAMELQPFRDRCERMRKYAGGDFVFRGGRYDEIRIAFVESGSGFARARRAATALIDAHSPAWVLSAGFSGALQEKMHVGDIVMANSIVDTHGHELSIDLGLSPQEERGLYVGRIVTADDVVRKVDEKRALGDRHQALAVDMESLAVAQVCRDAKTRFLAVRVISDDLSADLPPEVSTLVGSTGSKRLGAAVGSLWKRPGSIKEMWNLRTVAHSAAQRMATFLDGVVTQLYNQGHKDD